MKALMIGLQFSEDLDGRRWETKKIRIKTYDTELEKNYILTIYKVGRTFNKNGVEVTVLAVKEASMEDLKALV